MSEKIWTIQKLFDKFKKFLHVSYGNITLLYVYQKNNKNLNFFLK